MEVCVRNIKISVGSQHFQPEDFETELKSQFTGLLCCRTLKSDAIPSIFPLPFKFTEKNINSFKDFTELQFIQCIQKIFTFYFTLKPYFKIDFSFLSSIYTQYPIMTKRKQAFTILLQI